MFATWTAGRWMGSLLLHALLLLGLAVLPAARPSPSPRSQSVRITLRTPVRPEQTRPVSSPKPVPPPPPIAAPKARAFEAPALVSRREPPHPAPLSDAPLPQPRIELEPAVAPAPNPIRPPQPDLPPQPIILGKLNEASSQPLAQTASGGLRTSGFAASTAPAGIAPERTLVARAGFSSAETASPTASTISPARAPALTPVEILSKPNPNYTAEARALRIEGDVALEVLFSSAGEIRVLQVLAGLGHGLDEAAKESAARIRFHPARRGGTPVDQVATVRIIFRLAY